ncbi:hypothetical protein PA27867_2184 [Cryobacterium arcticum]|uniref:Uncharacterized protein n=1 Tax=Cryobacterium arcticum TaxID=670052 RepID=A0A1B1BKW2_9MICO|nr:hypothetical protein PA27867_2184 [Cryobacterium arcticum]
MKEFVVYNNAVTRYSAENVITQTRKPPLYRGFLLLGYLDSNQEQMIAISAESLPRNWGGIPRISAVFMGLSVRAGTE